MILVDGFSFKVQSRFRPRIGTPQTQSTSCRGENRGGTAQIVGAARQHRVYPVPDQCKEAHAAQAIVLLQRRKRPLHAGTYAADHSIALLVSRGRGGMGL